MKIKIKITDVLLVLALLAVGIVELFAIRWRIDNNSDFILNIILAIAAFILAIIIAINAFKKGETK